MKNYLKKKGITLVALVITIIIMLILAGIGLSVVLGDNGIIAEFKNAKAFYEDLEKKENKRLYRANLQKALGLISKGQTAKDDRVYIDSNEDYAVIPKGFAVSKINGETTIENGLVIYQTNGENIKDWTTAKANYNQYVWIPVEEEDLSLIYDEANFLWNLSFETSVTSKYMSKSLTGDSKLGNRELERKHPGTTSQESVNSYREPDLTVNDTEQRTIEMGFSPLLDGEGNTIKTALRVMAESLVNDYENMIESIKLYGGFYVGRYELGRQDDDFNKPMVRQGTVMNWTNWYFNYKSCKKLNLDDENNVLNSNAEIRMMWGCLWDQTCRFINTRGQKVNLDDSRSYGNYNNSTVSTDVSGFDKFNNTTGRSEYWKVNNIYDLAGNCWERTQEVYSSGDRAIRGGQTYGLGNEESVTIRYCGNPTSSEAYTVTTRPVIYIKTKDLNLVHQKNETDDILIISE